MKSFKSEKFKPPTTSCFLNFGHFWVSGSGSKFRVFSGSAVYASRNSNPNSFQTSQPFYADNPTGLPTFTPRSSPHRTPTLTPTPTQPPAQLRTTQNTDQRLPSDAQEAPPRPQSSRQPPNPAEPTATPTPALPVQCVYYQT